MSAEEAMARVDADHDGVITLKEHMDFALHEADARFSRMDRDYDGKLTKKELDGAAKHRQSMRSDGAAQGNGNGGGGPPPPDGEVLLTRGDANHDGMLDINENRALAQHQAEMRFKAADKNGDKRIERDEMQAKPPGPPPQQRQQPAQ